VDHQLTPAGVLSFFVTALFETVTRQAGFIVPTLLEPVTLLIQITDDSGSFRVARIRVYRYESVLVVVPIKAAVASWNTRASGCSFAKSKAPVRSLPEPVSRSSSISPLL